MSDPWEQLRFTTLDAMVTVTKMEGSAAILHGHTTPERWPYVVVIAIGSPGNEKAFQLAAEFHERIKALGAPVIRAGSNPKATVHFLHEGRPLCDFSELAPAQWPAGHQWTYAGGIGGNCKGCLTSFAARAGP